MLQIHFLGLGLRDPVIKIPKAWTHNGTVIPNDVGAVYAGVPFRSKYYPAYWVGKTFIESKGKTLYLKTYLMDKSTLLTKNSVQRDCFAIHKDSVGLALASDITTRIDYVAQKASHLVLGTMSGGSTAIDADGIVKVEVTE